MFHFYWMAIAAIATASFFSRTNGFTANLAVRSALQHDLVSMRLEVTKSNPRLKSRSLLLRAEKEGGDSRSITNMNKSSNPSFLDVNEVSIPINGEAAHLSESNHDSASLDVQISTSLSDKKKTSFPIVLWRFTRPHTIIGSAVAIPAIHMLAAPTFASIFSLPSFISLLYAMIPSLLMNIYITGLNQITDVEIDKINKPSLPIASGDLSIRNAIWIVSASLVFSLLIGASHPIYGTQGLNFALWGSAILGTIYSLPPFRLKRFPFLAAFCIVAVRGAVINAGFYAHAKSAVFSSLALSSKSAASLSLSTMLKFMWTCFQNDAKCRLSSIFFGIFGIVIALMKDVPDVKGDTMANIKTFSVRIGQKRIFHSMRWLISILFYSFGIGFVKGCLDLVYTPTTTMTSTFTKLICRSGVALLAFSMGNKARKQGQDVNAEDSKEVYDYYMYLWKLFYTSYLALPFVK